MQKMGGLGLRAAQVANQANNSIDYSQNFGGGLVSALKSYKDTTDWMNKNEADKAKQGFMNRYSEKHLSGDTEGAQAEYYAYNPGAFEQNQADMQKKSMDISKVPDKIKQIESLISTGMDRNQALATVYGGTTEAVGGALASGFGSAFDKKLQEEEAKNLATEREKLRGFEASMPKIEEDVDRLLKLSDTATFTGTGLAKDFVARQFGRDTEGSKARAEMLNIVENNVLPQLRSLLGAQFTEREGEKVKQTIMDPNLSPEEKKVQLRSFLRSKYDALRQSSEKVKAIESKYGAENSAQSGEVIDYRDL